MTTLSLPYGRGQMVVHVQDAHLKGVLRPAHQERGTETEEAMVRSALSAPIASSRLSELAKGKSKILVITSDHTRPVPSHITMPLYLEEIRKGSPNAEIRILIATGMHRPTTEAELRQKLGDKIVNDEQIVVHDAQKDEDMVRLGTLPSGGELWLNRLITWAELVVSEGFIEPHFFAGFSGGRKSILPGVASRKTVLYNHNAQFIKSPYAAQGSLAENPIHQDMLFAAQKAGLRFILNVLIDADKRIVAAVAGDPVQAHAEGCKLCGEATKVQRVTADIAITSNGGYPLDQNVYQSVKGMTAAESCVRPGGVIIMCAALGDGHGGESFFRWFADRDNAAQVTRDIENIQPGDTRMDQWEAQILARVMNHATCIFVTGEENRALVEQMHLRWAATADDALAQAQELLGPDATVAVIPDGVGVIIQ
ncbi:MAG: nickel-dependent lactate racemase [Eubacteriales bacterium]|nr:nickel-dependent lactate racemase [Eubacteriales bacterium]